MQLVRYRQRVRKATLRHPVTYFVTIYFDYRKRANFTDLPLFESLQRDEKIFRQFLSKTLRALRDKARREKQNFQYVCVLALGRFQHRIHRRVHMHMICTWLPIESDPEKCPTTRLECPWLAEKLAILGLIAWVEIPREIRAVINYTVDNLKTIIGKPEFAGLHTIRFSQEYEEK